MLIEFINEDLAAENQSTVLYSVHCTANTIFFVPIEGETVNCEQNLNLFLYNKCSFFFTIIDGNVMSAFLVNKQTHLLKRQYHDVLFAQSTLWSVLRWNCVHTWSTITRIACRRSSQQRGHCVRVVQDYCMHVWNFCPVSRFFFFFSFTIGFLFFKCKQIVFGNS